MTPGKEKRCILLMSDVHARYEVVNSQVEHAEAELGVGIMQVLVLGDFGLFAPNLHRYFRKSSQRFARPVAFIEGNHEDFTDFDRLVSDYADVVAHLPRNSVTQLDRWKILCIGGARYMDAWSTPRGSEVQRQDIETCLKHEAGSVDLVISHDCPPSIGVTSGEHLEHLGPPGVEGFELIVTRLRPRVWVFGHHHRWHECNQFGTRFIGLPESWRGYAILQPSGDIDIVQHEIPLSPNRGWPRWFGRK